MGIILNGTTGTMLDLNYEDFFKNVRNSRGQDDNEISDLIYAYLKIAVLKIAGVETGTDAEVGLIEYSFNKEQATMLDDLLTAYMVENYALYLKYTDDKISNLRDLMIEVVEMLGLI